MLGRYIFSHYHYRINTEKTAHGELRGNKLYVWDRFVIALQYTFSIPMAIRSCLVGIQDQDLLNDLIHCISLQFHFFCHLYRTKYENVFSNYYSYIIDEPSFFFAERWCQFCQIFPSSFDLSWIIAWHTLILYIFLIFSIRKIFFPSIHFVRYFTLFSNQTWLPILFHCQYLWKELDYLIKFYRFLHALS